MSNLRKLILMRHGEARQDGPSDKARVLSPHGVDQSIAAGRRLKEALRDCDKAVVSDAKRTQETARHVLTSFSAKSVTFEPDLYSANDTAEFIKAISRHIGDGDRVVLVIGHNPVISSMAGLLTGAYYGFSPSDFLIVSIEAGDWMTALESSGAWTSLN